MATLDSKYTVKPSNIGEDKVYLGYYVGKVFYGDGSYDCTMRYVSYVKEDINIVKKRLKEDGLEYKNNLFDVNFFSKEPLFVSRIQSIK